MTNEDKMKRYYYTDPLKAAWMAREFGVDYECGIWRNFDDWPKGNIYISNDSLPIFEPKVGDMDKSGRILKKVCLEEIYDNWTSDYDQSLGVVYYRDDEGDDRDMPLSVVKIIQRDNKPFFIPEVEE